MKLLKIIKVILGKDISLKINYLKERYSLTYHPEILKRKLFYQQFVRKNDFCFDVGANIGNRIIPLLMIGAKVLAVEPQESCYKYLKSKFGKRITIITKGLCEKECTRKFHISNMNVVSSFSDEWINSVKKDRFKEHNWDKTIDVKMTTLDNLIDEFGIPSFIKIDVEGYELEVLKGLSKPINMISFEYTVPEQTSKIAECIKVVENNSNILLNYSIGESMGWALTEWLSVSKFLELIKTIDFLKTGFGDIYLKQNNNLLATP